MALSPLVLTVLLDTWSSAKSVGAAVGYVAPAGAAFLTTAANGVTVAYDEETTRFWKTGGYVAGGVELAIGAGLLAFRHESTGRVVIGAIPVGLGVAALATALFAREEPVLGPSGTTVTAWASSDGAGVAWVGRFR